MSTGINLDIKVNNEFQKSIKLYSKFILLIKYIKNKLKILICFDDKIFKFITVYRTNNTDTVFKALINPISTNVPLTT